MKTFFKQLKISFKLFSNYYLNILKKILESIEGKERTFVNITKIIHIISWLALLFGKEQEFVKYFDAHL